MGKRKKSRSKLLPKKKMAKLDTSFCCPFCNHPNSVECSIDKKCLVAQAYCGVCQAIFNTTAHVLTEPIDVYSEWLDECERVNEVKEDDDDDDGDI